MFIIRKTSWETVDEDFNPESLGFEFNPEISVIKMIDTLLKHFDQHTPVKGKLHDFIGAILIDGWGYWQLRGELSRLHMVSCEAELKNDCTLYGFPVFLTCMEGISLALKLDFAPIMAAEQIHQRNSQIELTKKALDNFTKGIRTKIEEEVPDEENIH